MLDSKINMSSQGPDKNKQLEIYLGVKRLNDIPSFITNRKVKKNAKHNKISEKENVQQK